MKKLVLSLLILYASPFANAQLKTGSNPAVIGNGQLLELEKNGQRGGLKLAEVALSGTTDNSTINISSAAAGTLVWNTGTGGLSPAGLYVWTGSAWVPTVTGTVQSGALRVGIGTSSPTNILEVNGAGGTGTGLQLPTGAAAGKVLVSDINGNTSWQTGYSVVYSEIHGTGFGINYNADAKITGLGNTKADNVKSLYGSAYGWDNTNKRWVAPFNGKYRVTINGYFNPMSTANPRIYAYKNGTITCGILSVSQPSGASDISTSTSAIISLNTGDYVEFRAGAAAGIRLYMDDYHTFIRIESVE